MHPSPSFALLLLALGGPATVSWARQQAPLPASAGAPAPTPAPQVQPARRLFDLDAESEDAVALLKRVAADAKVSLSFVGTPPASKASVALRQATIEKAVDLITRSAGLAYRQTDDDTFVVGSPNDVAAAFPAAVPGAPAGNTVTRLYRCRHVDPVSLVATLQATFDPQQVKVSVGPQYLSPTLEADTVADNAGSAGGGGAGVSVSPLIAQQDDQKLRTREIVLSGDVSLVERAIALARQLDRHRAQVKINVRITDIGSDALREFGVRWSYSNYTAREGPVKKNGVPDDQVPGLNFARFNHDPTFITAAISALETRNQAKLLAMPTLFVLDGERGFLLIGQRLTFPILVNSVYGQGQTFSQEEVRVGIYVQVAAQIDHEGDVILAIYPQVSAVTGFLSVNGANYPQISTREQQTTIRARSGETIVIGGLIRDEELSNIERVPILSRIPILGELFTYRKKSRSRSELVIMLTPEVQASNEEGAAAANPAATSVPARPATPPSP